MCGITGFIYSDRARPAEESILRKMNDTLTHRGPDDEGFFLEGPVALAMRRLSIIDVAGGGQPHFNEDRSIVSVCNGEIYNYATLRDTLSKKGHNFSGSSDAEILPHLYEEKSDAFVEELDGMFGLALWDKKRNKLILARDPMGKKPLYYTQNRHGLFFGSELKSLLAHPLIEKKIDELALKKYLTLEYIPAPQSIFSDINKLPAGHQLVLDRASLVKQYWNIPLELASNIDWSQGQNLFKTAFKSAVKKRLMSDVPLGVFLSGGLDSSSIVAMMSELIDPSKIKTFSIAFEDASFDESSYASQIAHFFGTSHREKTLSPGMLLEILPKVISFLDEPLADASILPTYLLSKFAREEVTVALGGDGGDELLAGYPTFQAAKLYQIYSKLPRLLRNKFIKPLINKLPVNQDNISFDFKLKQFLKGADYGLPMAHFIWTGAFSPAELTGLLGVEVTPKEVFKDLLLYESQASRAALGNRELYYYQKLYLQDDILTKTDRASMANSLEVRAPFLDKQLVETVSRMPYSFKMRGWDLKALLRQSMRGLLPKNILARPKKGFGIPVAKWIASDLKEKVQDTLNREKIIREGNFNPTYVEKLLKEHYQGRVDHRKKLWTLLMFEWWLDEWGRV